jgi:hypothetical protein
MMNLTLSNMLKLVTLCAGTVTLSASATVFMGDSFEAGEANEGAENKPIGQYKQVVSGASNETTNRVWTALDGDASKLVADASAYAGNHRPMWGVDTNLVLNLATEGQILTRTVGEPKTFSDEAPIYIDTLVKFTPSEEPPDVRNQLGGENVKVAVFVNAQTNLVIYHGTGAGVPGTTVVSSLGALDPALWYHLTIRMGALDGVPIFSVSLNDEEISTADGYDYSGMPFGPWFLSAVGAQYSVNAVAFQGTGMIDELVVTDDLLPPQHEVTLAFNEALVSVTRGGIPVTSNGTIFVHSEIVIDAADWHQIASVTGSVADVYGGPVGALVNVSTGTVDAICGDTVTITVVPYRGGSAISTGLGASLPADKVAAWALANTLGEGDLDAAMLDDYLMNVAPGTEARPVITSLSVDDVAGLATVTVGATSGAVDFSAINGTLVVFAANALEAEFVETASFAITVSGSDEVTVEVQLDAGAFMKAVVK